MQKKRPDKEDTQEIKLPKSRDDYGDNFENSYKFEDNVKNKTKSSKIKKEGKKNLIILISSIIVSLIIVIIIVCMAISNSSLKQNVKNTTSTTSSTTKTPTTVPNTTSSYTNLEETEVTTTITEESTAKGTNEPTTAIFTTEPVATTQEETDVTEETFVTNETSITEEDTYTEKTLSVSDILVLKTDDGLFIPKITGRFIGYTPEELLNEVTVTTSSGTPKLSLPHLEKYNSFTFNMNLKDCNGELHIHIGSYDFYQDISSFPN